MILSNGEISLHEETQQGQENGDRNIQLGQLLTNPRLSEKVKIERSSHDIVWNVSHFLLNSLRKSDVAIQQDFPWLTGTALGGGHGVEVFSQM